MSSVEPTTDFSTLFRRAVADALADERDAQRRAVADIDPRVVARLAMAPVWTAAVVDASGLAPLGTLERLADAGLVEHVGDRFVVEEARASDALAPVLRGGPDVVTRELREVAAGVRRARERDVDIPPALDRLALLTADAYSVEQVVDRLIATVTAASDIADAVNWIDAAARLETTLGREMVGARLRAGRVVAGRRRDDDLARFLTGYFPRPTLEAKLRAVCDGGPDDPWAVHLRAPAGSGKTWLVRRLDAVFPSDGSAGSVVRVDFDYLRPTYPGTEPGLLLTLLAAQLRQFAGPETLIRFDRLDDLVADWHARIDEAERTRPGEVPAIRETRRDLVVDAFASAVQALPRPVVLILDTTEELDKVSGGDANVRSMIALLQAMHERVMAVRVVLSGRRPLPLPPDAEELPVPGFDREEAVRFVAWVGLTGERAVAVVERVTRDAPVGGLNPFDLARLARWARDDPDFDAAAIRAADDDQYVEQRIIARLSAPELRDALPIVVALGRFDVPMLGAVTGTAGEALDRLHAAAANQEWISVEAAGILTVEPQLAVRLAAYLARHRRVEWDSARAHAGAVLRTLCLDLPRTVITVEHVAAAIRLADADADRAGAEAWWARVEDRARADRDYGWLLGITARLLGADGPVLPGHRLHAAVLASHAACLDRESPNLPTGHPELWRRAYESAAPGSRMAARAAAHLPEHLPGALEEWGEQLDEALAASFVGGAEAWAELDPRTAEALCHAVEAGAVSPELSAMAAVLAGRAYGRIGARDRCRKWLNRAIEQVVTSVSAPSGAEWIDWPVDDVAARVRLWAASTWWPALGSAIEADTLLDAPGPVENVDQERRTGFSATLALARGRTSTSVYETSRPFAARCALHLALPPLVVLQALTLARRGEVDRAVAVLDEARTRYQSGPEYLAVERALMLLVRRFRLRDIGIGLTSGLFDSTEVADRSLLADLDAHDGDKLTLPPWRRFLVKAAPTPDGFHQWWRVVRAGDPEALDSAQTWPFPSVVGPDSPEDDLHRRLDAAELTLLTATPLPPLPDVGAWARAHPREPEAALRLHLRRSALSGSGRPDQEIGLLVGRLGRNFAAEIALDEGESLALRLAGRARVILDRAVRWFGRAEDAVGALRAATVRALAVLADEDADHLSTELDAVRTAYVRIPRAAGLPPWELLAERPGREVGKSPRGWLPWVARVGVLLQAATRRWPDEDLLPELYAWFGSTVVDGRVVLPAELAKAVETVAGSRAVPGPAPVPTPADVGLPPPARLEITGYRSSTHIARGYPARITAVSAQGAFLDNVTLDETDPLIPFETRLQLHTSLVDLLIGLPPNVPIALHHDADLGATPWEAIVTAALGQAVLEGPEPRTIWRRLQKSRRRPPVRSADWTVLQVSADPPVPISWPHPVRYADPIGRPTDPSARVVHLVGWASETRSGVGLAPERPGRKWPRDVWTAAALVRDLPAADLVIIQGLPDPEPVLADWSREQAAYLRQLGAHFAQDGVPAVVVIPPAGTPSAPQPLADLLADAPEQLSAAGVVRAVEAVRTKIRQQSWSERAVEDALGVCLYLSDALTELAY